MPATFDLDYHNHMIPTKEASPRNLNTNRGLASLKKALATNGLELFGWVPTGLDPQFQAFQSWIKDHKHAGMKFLERNTDLRQNPERLFKGSKTILVVGLNYYLGDKLKSSKPGIAQYARFKDYHKTIRRRCEMAMKVWEVPYRVVVDSAPILERSTAARTGMGFIGKNTMFIHPHKGSFFLLGAILTTAELPIYDPSLTPIKSQERSQNGGCGTCRRCVVYCPTGALAGDYTLDARKCLAYYSIEHRGPVPKEFWKHFDKYWFGCDICQLACPYNRKATITTENQRFSPNLLDLYEVATMDQAYYEKVFGGTPMTRAKIYGLQRNALIAMFVTGHNKVEQAIEFHKDNNDLGVRKTIEQYLVESSKS